MKNVPCEECEQCGEIEISNEVMQKLDKIIDTAKQLMQEVAVIDYKMTA
ncbi:YgiT-type zinc finger protein [Anaerovibrio lipolyticus]